MMNLILKAEASGDLSSTLASLIVFSHFSAIAEKHVARGKIIMIRKPCP